MTACTGILANFGYRVFCLGPSVHLHCFKILLGYLTFHFLLGLHCCMNVPDEGVNRNMFCANNQKSTILLYI